MWTRFLLDLYQILPKLLYKKIEIDKGKANPICPYCKDVIDFNLIKFCSVNISTEYQAGDNITFNLIMKDKRSLTLYNTNNDPSLEYQFYLKRIFKSSHKNLRFLPKENSIEFSFSKYFVSETIDNKYLHYKRFLENALIEEMKHKNCELLYDKMKIDSISQCIEELNLLIQERTYSKQNENYVDMKSQTSHINSSQSTKSEEKNYSYFFQEKNGNIYYLHPINYNVLISEYEDEESIPTEITAKILEIEVYQMSPIFKNKFNYLNHIKDGNIFYLVEIDLKPLVSNIVLKQFHTVLKERSRIRNQVKEEEEHYDSFVQKMYYILKQEKTRKRKKKKKDLKKQS